MSDDLVISGGGSTAVATAELFEQAEQLHRVLDVVNDCRSRLSAIDRDISFSELRTANVRYSAITAEQRIDDAQAALGWAGAAATCLAAALGASAELYGAAERSVRQLNQTVAAKIGYALGYAFPALALLLAPRVAAVVAFGAAAYAVLPEQSRAGIRRWLFDQNVVLTDPALVTMVRLGVTSSDDFAAGLTRMDPNLVALLGDEGLGLLGLTSSAAAVAGLAGPLGALAETPVRVQRVSTRTDQTAAHSFLDRAERIPQGSTQIRIDRYHRDGESDRFEVYLGGTRDPGLVAEREPWDMTSNVNALSMGDAGSYRAAVEAMRMAGVEADSPVQFTGYSQGGLVAAALAGSGDYNAQGLFTVGGVVSDDLVPRGVDWVAIEHTDDLVPALGGDRSAPDAVLVRRQVFAGTAVPGDTLLPAHELARYRETAAMLDRSGDGRSGEMLTRLNRVGAGTTTVTTTEYLARRIPGD